MLDPLLEEKIREQIRTHKVLIYMKGTPEMPQCGFSYAAVRVLDSLGFPYTAINGFSPVYRDYLIGTFVSPPPAPSLHEVSVPFTGII